MALIPQVNLPDEDKLETLRELDQFRHWHSLDDQRCCLACGNLITGRQIKVLGDPHGSERLRLSCPTEGCNSIPLDWMLPTDEVLASAKAQTVAAEESNMVVSASADHATTERPASPWRRFTFHFKRAS